MYIVVEDHELISGFKTFKYSWWFKDDKGNKSPIQKTIHSNYDMSIEARLFLKENPTGRFLFRNFSESKLTLKDAMKHELIKN